MYKKFRKVACVAMMLFCGVNANAQIDLSGVLGSVLGGSSSSSSSSSSSISDLISGVTSIFSKNKQATTDNIVGTWEYSEPAIVFTSDNLITKAAAKVAANKVETKLQTYLTKYGIKKGSFSITFNEDGTFSEKISGKTISGKWTISDKKLSLTYGSVKTIDITTQVDGSNLQIVTDASELLSLMKTLGTSSTNSTLSTITTLMKSVDGMQVGITLVKK